MVRHANTLGTIVFLTATACSHAASPPKTAAQADPKPASAIKAKKAATKTHDGSGSAEQAQADEQRKEARKLGDFHVYEYSGAFTKEPVRLTEQVVARDGENVVVDFVLEEGQTMTALRARMTEGGQIVAVSRIKDDGEEPATIADYEAMVKRTQVVPETNEAVVGTEHTSCMVGDEQVDCDVTTYVVSMGGKEAQLSVSRSDKVPGRDIGGSIIASDGTVLYSARLVERGNEPPAVDAFAKMDKAEFVPDGL